MNCKGSSLIEMMVTLAVLSLATLGVSASLGTSQGVAADLLRSERALQVAEYQADVLTRGEEADPEVLSALLGDVPGGTLERRRPAPGVTAVVVGYRDSRGRPQEIALHLVLP